MIFVALGMLGLVFGSFVNALVWRLHQQTRQGKKQPASQKYSITRGRSMCPNCQHQLAPRDLIPVISWLMLRGKCRYCHKKFADTPFSELAVPGLFVLSYAFWPLDWTTAGVMAFGLWLALLVGFVALIITDVRWYILPNRIIFPLQALAAGLATLHLLGFPDRSSLPQLIGGLLFSAGLLWVLHWVSKGQWLGYGDVKLAVVIGLVLGRADLALLMLFIASLLGSLVAIPLMLAGKASHNSRIPFGPFLVVATIMTYLFGLSLTSWYTNRFLFL